MTSLTEYLTSVKLQALERICMIIDIAGFFLAKFYCRELEYVEEESVNLNSISVQIQNQTCNSFSSIFLEALELSLQDQVGQKSTRGSVKTIEEKVSLKVVDGHYVSS